MLTNLAGCCAGKRTFQSSRLSSQAECTSGVPTLVYKLHKVTVQWVEGPEVAEVQGATPETGTTTGGEGDTEEGSEGSARRNTGVIQAGLKQELIAYETIASPEMHTTVHFCRLPVAYAVEAIGTPFGSDEASIEFNEDGSLKKATQKRDHQIDELITSVTEGAKNLSGAVLESGLDSNNPYDFYPRLPSNASVVAIIDILPMD